MNRAFNSICNYFEGQAKTRPDKIAAICMELRLTYRELNNLVQKRARYLLEKGILKGDVVALIAERSVSYLATVLAILKAGGCYLPIDKNYPLNRINYILQNSKAAFLVFEGNECPAMYDVESDKLIAMTKMDYPQHEFNDVMTPELAPDDLAYIIYTSGTTGTPKGVKIHHAGMMNHFMSKISILNLDENCIIAQTASQCFDISIWQFMTALQIGGTTLIVKNECIISPEILINYLNYNQATIVEFVPSYLSLFLKKANADRLPFLKFMISTGEMLSVQLATIWFKKFQNIPLVNAYGPTETSDDVCHYVMKSPPTQLERIPVGRPIVGCNLVILDENMGICGEGRTGEIYISGICVGPGYCNDQEKTDQFFLPSPFYGGGKMYRTGDLGYQLPDGNLVFVGRKDNQIKWHGYRIELEEIECYLMEYPGIKVAAVFLREEHEDALLCACVAIEKPISKQELVDYCNKGLPYYMVPSYFILVEKLPLTVTGKVDKKILMEEAEIVERWETDCPQSVIEEDVIARKIKVLLIENFELNIPFEKLSNDVNLLDLGANSLLFIKFIISVEDEFDIDLSEMIDMTSFTQIGNLVQYIKKTIEKQNDTCQL